MRCPVDRHRVGGPPGATSDPCPTPPGPTGDGCVVTGRLSRLVASGNVAGPEQPLIDDWCQQYPSHSLGTLQFGPDGALYVSAGDGASFNFADWGQDGSPVNPCGDPPGAPGSVLTPPTAEGGALRAQDLRTASDPATLDGTILRLDPNTGAAMAGNPFISNSDPNARRVIASGLRNPFRMTVPPGDVGALAGRRRLERLGGDRPDPQRHRCGRGELRVAVLRGIRRQAGYDAADLNICESLYAAGSGAVATPQFVYQHSNPVVAGETCPNGSSSTSGVAFYQGGAYPDSYDGGLFFADYSRDCIWFAPAGGGGQPNFNQRMVFVADAANPVNLEIGPNGDVFYADFDGGAIRRITFGSGGPGSDTYLSDLTPTSATNGWGPYERDRSNGEQGAADGGPIRLGGVTYARGLGTHAASDIRFALGGNCTNFTALIGVDDEVAANGTVTFSVIGDGTTRYTSPTLTGSSATVPISVPISGVNELRLVVAVATGGPDYDHADWADARVTCGSGAIEPASGADHLDAIGLDHVGGRSDGRLLRIGRRSGGRHARRIVAVVDAAPAPLPRHLPYPHHRDVHRWRRELRGARPRVPLAPRAAADGHRLERHPGIDQRPASAADRGAELRQQPERPPAGGRQHVHRHALPADGDRRLHELGQRADPAVPGRQLVRVQLVVRRWRSDPRDRGSRDRRHLHRDLHRRPASDHDLRIGPRHHQRDQRLGPVRA